MHTGRYSPRAGIYTSREGACGAGRGRKIVPPDNQTILAAGERTFAEALSEAGYATAHIGKWHLGSGTWQTTPGGVIRVSRYKLIEFFETGDVELYNLDEDIAEQNNLAELER